MKFTHYVLLTLIAIPSITHTSDDDNDFQKYTIALTASCFGLGLSIGWMAYSCIAQRYTNNRFAHRIATLERRLAAAQPPEYQLQILEEQNPQQAPHEAPPAYTLAAQLPTNTAQAAHIAITIDQEGQPDIHDAILPATPLTPNSSYQTAVAASHVLLSAQRVSRRDRSSSTDSDHSHHSIRSFTPPAVVFGQAVVGGHHALTYLPGSTDPHDSE